jgi:peptide methionine sulfoxide reductase MsrA
VCLPKFELDRSANLKKNTMEYKKETEVTICWRIWCTEAFLEIKGVKSIVPGHIGGKALDPSYKDI